MARANFGQGLLHALGNFAQGFGTTYNRSADNAWRAKKEKEAEERAKKHQMAMMGKRQTFATERDRQAGLSATLPVGARAAHFGASPEQQGLVDSAEASRLKMASDERLRAKKVQDERFRLQARGQDIQAGAARRSAQENLRARQTESKGRINYDAETPDNWVMQNSGEVPFPGVPPMQYNKSGAGVRGVGSQDFRREQVDVASARRYRDKTRDSYNDLEKRYEGFKESKKFPDTGMVVANNPVLYRSLWLAFKADHQGRDPIQQEEFQEWAGIPLVAE